MSAIWKRFAVLFVSFFLYLISFAIPTFAQSPLPSTVSPTSPVYTDLLVSNLFHTFSCLAIGQSTIGQPCLTYQITKNAQGVVQSIPVLSSVNLGGGVLGTTTSLIGSLFVNPPVRASDYLASVGQGLGIVKEVHAQGVVGSGNGVLNPILGLWTVSRNIAYVFMIFIFLIIGLMVMFRQRINPQTVITAQSALPGLVIGLILITFSYFLAGLISDMAFVGTNIVGAYFSAVKDPSKPQNLVKDLNDNKSNVITIFSKFSGIIRSEDATQALEIVFNAADTKVQGLFRLTAGLMAFQFGNQVGHVLPFVGDLAGIITGVLGSVVTAAAAPLVIGQVLSYVAIFVLIFSMFKLLLRLINSYLTIIFLTLTAPFHFLAAALPGRQGIATGWMLNMLANILVFPAIIAVFYFVAFLLAPLPQFQDKSNPQNNFNPPFQVSNGEIASENNLTGTVYAANPAKIIGNQTFPLFGGLDVGLVTIILAFGALIASPAIPDIIVRSIGRAGQAGQLIGQEASGNIAGGRGYANQGQMMGQVGGKIAQDYNQFRGVTPGYSPAKAIGWQAKFGGFFKPKQ